MVHALLCRKNLICASLCLIAFLGMHHIVRASASEGPSCTLRAKVIARGTETRQLSGANGKVSTYPSKYILVEVLATQRKGMFGNCDFVKEGDVFKIGSGDYSHLLKVGDTLVSGVEYLSSMGPSGAVLFINWKPISLLRTSRLLPADFELYSDAKPERSSKKKIGGKVPSREDYAALENACKKKGGANCCRASVATMKKGNFNIARAATCLSGYRMNTMRCIDAYQWCEPTTRAK